jgi:hypothetical protein
MCILHFANLNMLQVPLMPTITLFRLIDHLLPFQSGCDIFYQQETDPP